MATTNDRILLGTRKGLIEAHKTNGSWRLMEPALEGQPIVYAVRDPRDGALWASISHGHWGVKLSRSKADDGTFEEVSPPKYPEDTGKSAKYYWVLEPGHAERPGTFHVGTEPGGLFTTTDDGATWELNRPLWRMCVEDEWPPGGRDEVGIHSIVVDPRDPDHLYVAASSMGVSETRDGGATWAYVNRGLRMDYAPPEARDAPFGYDPHCVTRSPADPDVLWQANHCGVYRSKDGAATWDEISDKPYVYFGFPIAAHPSKAGTAWIVPMHSDQNRTTFEGRLFLMRTDDAGETWNEQMAGLPQAGAFDFPYRHSLDVAPDGETLVLGTTSGNAYVSGDGGASWEVLSHTLPLIYSARFA